VALHQETVVVHQAAVDSGKSDDNGRPIITPGADIELVRCNVQPITSDEVVGNQNPVTSKWRVSTHRGDVHDEITKDATVTWRGDEYTVLGQPGSFHAVRPHTEFTIERTEG
jgi:hypothetical protein